MNNFFHSFLSEQRQLHLLSFSNPSFQEKLWIRICVFICVCSKEYAKHIYNTTNLNGVLPPEAYGHVIDEDMRRHHTTHVSVIGPNEDHVSVTR